MNRTITLASLALTAGLASAQANLVTGGQTSVLLDTATLSSAAGLDLSSVSGTLAGSLPGSVAFPINARDAVSLPTTFAYDDGLASFNGSIEHTGSVFFNTDTVEVGNFSIGFDVARVGGNLSGFFVESTTGVSAILFDVAAPSSLTAVSGDLTIGADLLVSPEFASFLGNSALAGADVGDALVQAVPAPGAVASLAAAGLFAARRRR